MKSFGKLCILKARDIELFARDLKLDLMVSNFLIKLFLTFEVEFSGLYWLLNIKLLERNKSPQLC